MSVNFLKCWSCFSKFGGGCCRCRRCCCCCWPERKKHCNVISQRLVPWLSVLSVFAAASVPSCGCIVCFHSLFTFLVFTPSTKNLALTLSIETFNAIRNGMTNKLYQKVPSQSLIKLRNTKRRRTAQLVPVKKVQEVMHTKQATCEEPGTHPAISVRNQVKPGPHQARIAAAYLFCSLPKQDGTAVRQKKRIWCGHKMRIYQCKIWVAANREAFNLWGCSLANSMFCTETPCGLRPFDSSHFIRICLIRNWGLCELFSKLTLPAHLSCAELHA